MGMIQDLQKMDEERRREVATMRAETNTFVKELNKGSAQRRSDMAVTLRDLRAQTQERKAQVATIAKEAAAIVEAANTFVKDLAKGSTERASDVATMRAETDAMVKDLAEGSAQRRSDMAVTLRDLRAQTQERKAQVATIAKEAAAIVEAANTFVKDLAKGSTERASDVATIHEMVWGKAPSKKVAAPPVEEVPVGELRDRVFAYLADHPDGTKLVELEEEFGIARIQIAKVIRVLMDDNKVEKRNLLYFAI